MHNCAQLGCPRPVYGLSEAFRRCPSRHLVKCRASGGGVATGRTGLQAPKLAPQEQQSLQAYLDSNGISSSALTSPQQLPPDAFERVLQTINAGASKQVQDLPQLEGAMLLAEQLHYSAPDDDISGAAAGASSASAQEVDAWQPIFASSGGFPRLLYIPVPEYFDMHRAVPDATAISISSGASLDITSSRSAGDITLGGQHPGTINIITELGPLTTHFLGTCTWLSERDFEYSISSIRLDLGGRSLTLPMPVKLENVLSFFLVTQTLACARSKLGGTMLLQANPDKGKQYFAAW